MNKHHVVLLLLMGFNGICFGMQNSLWMIEDINFKNPDREGCLGQLEVCYSRKNQNKYDVAARFKSYQENNIIKLSNFGLFDHYISSLICQNLPDHSEIYLKLKNIQDQNKVMIMVVTQIKNIESTDNDY